MVSYVVVGAPRGIGLDFVQALSTDPRNKVFAVVRNAETASPLREFVESEATSKNVVILQANLTDYNTLKLAAEEVSKATGGILDVLINNGALVIHEKGMLTIDAFPDEETLEKDFLDFFKTNVVGVTHAINAFLPLLRAGNSKKVLTISSSMGSPRTNLASNHDTLVSYAVSKAALNMVVVKFAARFKQEGFTFLSVSPGLVKTMSGRGR
ncbi:NAD-binding protein, partial [Fomitiporia mediterranea MF3/22]|uniref:NAD-binding protein n=1 Tax=Fomitiporia mediterranea (strain MF3/22) TaxID=694068 RepID=UPI00044095CA